MGPLLDFSAKELHDQIAILQEIEQTKTKRPCPTFSDY
jgi:uncharacterized small protein (DUF1192 family)